MISITRERLLTIQQWRETYGPGSNVVLPAEEAEELACIALERMDAKPVAIINGAREPVLYGEHIGIAIATQLYNAPPAPIAPKELRELLGTLFNSDGRRGADFDLFDYLKARDDIVAFLQRNE
ncbi:hypothetical protein [Enterobacter cloacae]|uniref:hypothetical protein n=1 Tax=Enterobacter cloacae TaxID=550 RepID=UPI001FFC6BFA|nr:hypothetical protein [Enterobacter cloacae]